MAYRSILLVALPAICLTAAGSVMARTPDEDQAGRLPVTGFIDQNADGVNDLFCDADGDGTNDVTGREYLHGFRFLDENGDGMNDLWTDADGDGVNDLGWMFGKGGRGTAGMNVLDYDRDNVNDITGGSYREGSYGGGDYGFIDEDAGDIPGPMVDENGNGVDDRLERARRGRGRHGHDSDVFIDEDGDGICDGRGDVLHRPGGGGHGRGHHGGGGCR